MSLLRSTARGWAQHEPPPKDASEMGLPALRVDLSEPDTDKRGVAPLSSSRSGRPTPKAGDLMTRENAAAKARRYLTEGRVVLTRVTPSSVKAIVRGDGATYTSIYRAGQWSCSCPARTDQCSHLRAVRLVTAPEVTR